MSQDEDAGMLFVHGEGFFAGAKCSVKLRGTLFRAGSGTSTTRVWPCRARSEQVVAITLGTTAKEPSGLLEGVLELRLAAQTSEHPFVAHSERAVRVRLPEASLSEGLAQSRAARAFAEELGLTLEPHARGLRIAQLTDHGPAARAGLRVRDVIGRLDGAPIERPTDLVPSPRSEAPVFELQRGGSTHFVAVPRQGAATRTEFTTLYGLACAIAFLAMMMLPVATDQLRERMLRCVALAKASWLALVVGGVLTLANALLFSSGSVEPRYAFLAPWLTLAVIEATRARHGLRERLMSLAGLGRIATGVACLFLLSEGSAQPHSAAPATWLLLCTPPAWLALLSIRMGLPRLDAQPAISWQIAWVWLMGTTAWWIASFSWTYATGSLEQGVGAWRTGRLILESALLLAWFMHDARARPARSVWLVAGLAALASAAWVVLSPSASISTLIGYASAGALLALIIKQVRAGMSSEARLGPDPMLEPFR